MVCGAGLAAPALMPTAGVNGFAAGDDDIDGVIAIVGIADTVEIG
jgi:hypothetical protein